jgi:hypothetical protein
MQKIISLFQRNYDGDGLVRDEVVPGAEWVVAGEGHATRKFDGTCCMVQGGKLFKRYDAKKGKTPPPGFIPAQEPDPVTGHYPGWIEVSPARPDDRWHLEAWHMADNGRYANGTYELCGPKVQGNPEKEYLVSLGCGPLHALIPHGHYLIADAPRDFAGLRDYLRDADMEGIVWHHPDGRMVKIKVKDFGLKRRCK